MPPTPPITILLPGANGQVGWEICRRCDPAKAHILPRSSAQLDITDAAAVRQAVDALKPDLVINAAAYTGVDNAESEPELAFAVNRDGPANLARACAHARIPLLHLSTDYVFDGSKVGAYTEEDEPRPLGIYGQSKWAGDEAVARQLEQHIILRVSWVFGAHGHNFAKTMLRLGAERDRLRVVADQHGCPTWAGHIADVLLQLAERAASGRDECWGTFHYCDQPATTWHGFARGVLDAAVDLGALSEPVAVTPIRTEEYPTAAPRPANTVLDCTKLRQRCGIDQGDWLYGLLEVLKELEQRHGWSEGGS